MIYVNVSVLFIGNTIYLLSARRNVLMGEASQILILALFFLSTCLQTFHASVLFLFIRIDIFLRQSRPPLFDKHVTKPSHCTLLANSPTFPAVTDRVVIIS